MKSGTRWRFNRVIFAGLMLLILAVGCGRDGMEKEAEFDLTAERVQVGEDGVVRVEVHSDDGMRFDLSRFRVPAGSPVRLVFRHKGRMSKRDMGHNWVLLDSSVRVEAFILDAVSAPDEDYLPSAWAGAVLAAVPMLGGGEQAETEFVAPATPGEYRFVCTFPGHFYAGMKGVMEVIAPDDSP